MENNILEVDSIIKRYNDKLILSDIYLKLKTGDIVGLLGRNGSGKSTLLKIIFGIEPSESKFIKVNDRVLLKDKEVISQISYLDQQSFLPNNLSVKKVISLSIKKEKLEDFCNDNLLKEIYFSKIRQLSGGELRYLEVKLLLYNESKFILLDEPFSGLSPLNIEIISNLIIKNSFQKGVILTDHNYREIINICSEIYLLKNGKNHKIKNTHELLEHGYIK